MRPPPFWVRFSLEDAIVERRREAMTVTLEEFMKDFTPEERAKVAARAAELVEEEGEDVGFLGDALGEGSAHAVSRAGAKSQ